jgi:hypothetical protein
VLRRGKKISPCENLRPRSCSRTNASATRSHPIAGRRAFHEGSRFRFANHKRTVAAHKYAVMELLQLKTNADLAQYAIGTGSFLCSPRDFSRLTVSYTNTHLHKLGGTWIQKFGCLSEQGLRACHLYFKYRIWLL